MDNVQSDPTQGVFIRDDLQEPDVSQTTQHVYRNDIEIRSSALKSSTGLSKERGQPPSTIG